MNLQTGSSNSAVRPGYLSRPLFESLSRRPRWLSDVCINRKDRETMPLLVLLGFLGLGVGAGVLGGIVGIGGGIILVPALVFLFKFEQHLAQGTSLAALIPPIGLWAA